MRLAAKRDVATAPSPSLVNCGIRCCTACDDEASSPLPLRTTIYQLPTINRKIANLCVICAHLRVLCVKKIHPLPSINYHLPSTIFLNLPMWRIDLVFAIIQHMNFKKICVLMGGVSNEREVSITSGKNVVEALASLGKYEVVPVVLDENSIESVPECDACFLALHGGWGESGGVQAALDARRIPYTGPGAAASQIAMDKVKTKLVLEMKGVPTAKWTLASHGTESSPLPLPVVVKPPCDGSSVGISKVSSPEKWKPALDAALAAQGGKGEVMVENFVAGREMTVAVLDGKPLPVIEICAKDGWYGYEEKYNSNETLYKFPEDPFLPFVQQIAVDAYKACGCRGVVRVDFRIDEKSRPFVLELNTLPGMTGHSLVPKAAAQAGIQFPELCERMLASASFDRG